MSNRSTEFCNEDNLQSQEEYFGRTRSSRVMFKCYICNFEGSNKDEFIMHIFKTICKQCIREMYHKILG